MSRLFPHTPYAEDQPYAYTLLTYHVLHRAFQTGATLGLAFSTLRRLTNRNPLLLLTTGRSALVATALMIPSLPMYMAGKTEIEWKDRSWRLLESEGQVEVDDWGMVGMVGGVLAVGRRVGFVRAVGGAGVGNLVGVVGYLGWRYGVHGGKWPERVRE